MGQAGVGADRGKVIRFPGADCHGMVMVSKKTEDLETEDRRPEIRSLDIGGFFIS
jgi:hypothetical protein